MRPSFKVTPYSNGYSSGLTMQIIPLDAERNPHFENSIVVDELAFSLIEKFFLKMNILGHIGVKLILIHEKLL